MRELKGDWRDLFNGFMVALDLRKMSLALCGILFTLIFLGAPTIYLGNSIAPDYVEVPDDLGERVVARIHEAAGKPGSRRRLRTAAAVAVAAMVAVAGLGWGAVMAGRAERFAERAAQAERQRAAALEQFQGVLRALPFRAAATETRLGQLAPTLALGRGGGAVLQLVSPAVRVVEETRGRSAYEVPGATIEFLQDAEDRHELVALASMIGKYVREGAMRLFNDYWARAREGLRRTAGYGLDARRFYREIEPEIRRLNIPVEAVLRLR